MLDAVAEWLLRLTRICFLINQILSGVSLSIFLSEVKGVVPIEHQEQ
jgi:hypothetical protein